MKKLLASLMITLLFGSVFAAQKSILTYAPQDDIIVHGETNIEKRIRYSKQHLTFDTKNIPMIRRHTEFKTGDLAQYLFNYAYSKGKSLDFALTILPEKGDFDRLGVGDDKVSYGLYQLNINQHRDFITSPEFQNPFFQIDYAWDVRVDRKKKSKRRRNPRNGYYIRNLYRRLIRLNQ